MHRKQLAYIALAAGTALGLASVQLTARPHGGPPLVALGDTGAGDERRDRPAGGGHDQ
jgi:hypothetical protein